MAIDTIAAGSGPLGVKVDPSSHAHLTHKAPSAVSVINTMADTVIDTVAVGLLPCAVAMD